jgi:hypothetical protein
VEAEATREQIGAMVTERGQMQRAIIGLAVVILFSNATAYAKREDPKKVEPVTKAGIRYEAPNKPSRVVLVEAWDENSGKKLWERIVYEVKVDPKLEEDVQWDFITRLSFDGDKLLITTESHQQYRLDVKTRKVEKIEKVFAINSTVTVNVANVTAVAQGRQAVVDVQIPKAISLSKEATLLVLVGTDRKDVRPDEFGPPQNFALKGTSHEITPYQFRVSVALPKEKVTVRFILRDGKETLVDEKKEI